MYGFEKLDNKDVKYVVMKFALKKTLIMNWKQKNDFFLRIEIKKRQKCYQKVLNEKLS